MASFGDDLMVEVQRTACAPPGQVDMELSTVDTRCHCLILITKNNFNLSYYCFDYH